MFSRMSHSSRRDSGSRPDDGSSRMAILWKRDAEREREEKRHNFILRPWMGADWQEIGKKIVLRSQNWRKGQN